MNHGPDAFNRLIEDASRALFKRKHRLAVLADIAQREPGAVYVRDVARRLGIADNQIAPDFEALRKIGALEAIETNDRESWHQRVNHPIWQFALDTVEHLRETHGVQGDLATPRTLYRPNAPAGSSHEHD